MSREPRSFPFVPLPRPVAVAACPNAVPVDAGWSNPDLEADRAQEFLTIVVNHRGGRNDDQRFPIGDRLLPIAAYRGVVQFSRSKAAPTDYSSPTLAEAIVSLGSHTLGFGDEFGRIVAEIGDEEHWHALLALIRRPATTGEFAIALGNLGDKRALEWLAKYLLSPTVDTYKRGKIADALAVIGGQSARDILIDAISEDGRWQGMESQVAWYCAWTLAEIADEAAWSALVRQYKSRDADEGCRHALDRMGKRIGRRMLVNGDKEKA